MKIEISKDSFMMLKSLAENYYVVKGEPAMPIKEVIKSLIEDEYNKAHPREYQTSGFERQ